MGGTRKEGANNRRNPLRARAAAPAARNYGVLVGTALQRLGLHEVTPAHLLAAQRSGSAAVSPERSEGEAVGWNLLLGARTEQLSIQIIFAWYTS